MYLRHLLFIVSIVVLSNCSQKIEVIKGHAHNDYENENPLRDAIENGFTSIEVDVHLVDDNLYVSHDLPKELNPALTLETLYLNPLKDHILKNNGFIYHNYSGSFYLMIDFKSSAKPSYDKLKKILSNYLSIMPVISDNYSNSLSWNGYGEINDDENKKLIMLVQNTHAQNKKLRLWGFPDNAYVWRFLLDSGVDLINTDRLKEFREFILKYNSSCN